MNSSTVLALILLSTCAPVSRATTVATAPCPTASTTAANSTPEFVPRDQRGPRLIRIEGGDFEMGANTGDDMEGPAHRVHVDTFYMDETEVTAGQYAQCVKAGVCAEQKTVLWDHVPPEGDLLTRSEKAQLVMDNGACNLFRPEREDHPMNCVDWYQASRFCAWAFKRLPTEEEWEFAARGPEGRLNPWGNTAPTPDRANICGVECENEAKARHISGWGSSIKGWNDGFVTTAPVTAHSAGRTPLGLNGFGGNVKEWTSVALCAYGDRSCISQLRAVRDNSWVAYDVLPPTRRNGRLPELRYSFLGFRCALSTPAGQPAK